METKPYRIQSPEAIAKDYGGNKQKIAEAMQMGIVDPTAGVLAGMFIDRMRSAQLQEMAPKPTVAQQVMGGAPAQAPLAPAGGLGATAPAGPPMAPMGAAPMAPEAPEPAMGEEPMQSLAAGGEFDPPYMSGGGLSELPVPDTMFDENRDGSYAGGGIIAFAGAGEARSRFGSSIVAQESRGNYTARNKRSGALGKYQLMPATAKALASRLGLPFDPDLLTSDTPEAREYQDKLGEAAISEAWDYGKGDPGLAATYYHAGPDQKKWGSKTKAYREDILSRMGRPKLEEQDTQSPEGRRRSFEDQIKVARDMFGELPDSGLGEAEEYYRQQRSPEEKEKSRKYDMWTTLAQIGASMASTKSPQFLQAAGQAMAEAIPGAAASKKERDKAERDAVGALMDIAKLRRNEAKEVLEFGKDLYTADRSAEEAQTEREFRAAQAKEQREFQGEQADLTRANSLALAKIGATSRNSTFDIAYQNRYEQIKARLEQGVPIYDPVSKKRIPANASDAEIRVLAQRLARIDTAQAAAPAANMFGVPDPNAQGGAGAANQEVVDLGSIG